MPAFISKKLALVLLVCSWCAALVITLALNYSLAGPRLGPLYDVLMKFQGSPPVSTEIMLIETDEVIEPGDIFSVLMALSEMGASDLLVEVPVLGTGPGRTESGVEFSFRINDEFNLLERNIQNLFEAIRLGLVPPSESPDYVENLVELAERGRDRLNAAIIRQDEEGSALTAQAAAVFGKMITAADVRLQSPTGGRVVPWYSRPRPGTDRIFRRIAPVIPLETSEKPNPAIVSFFEQEPSSPETTEPAFVEHIVYHALKPRWKQSGVELTDSGPVLVNRLFNGMEELIYRFPLDRDGNILLKKPEKNNDFRRLTLDHFRNYEQIDRTLARLLKDTQSLGVYAETMPERIPLILYEYAGVLQEELLKAPDPVKRGDWIAAREDYIASLDDFLYGPAEMTLVNGYEELIAKEGLGEEGVARLQNLRDELIRAFVAMREKHRELTDLRTELATAVNSSFCIMGYTVAASGVSIPESSALLANALLTGRCITPGQGWFTVLLSLTVSLIALVCIYTLRPLLALLFGCMAALLCGAGLSANFVLTSYWLDPLIPAASVFGGVMVLVISRFCISYGRTLRFRLAYTAAVNTSMLNLLVQAGRPGLEETLCVQAAVITVKIPGLPAAGGKPGENALATARAAAEFRETFSAIFKQEGALVTRFGNDTASACFGSPPERIYHKYSRASDAAARRPPVHPAIKAVKCVTKLLDNPLAAAWQFGIDYGECAFSWSAETGYRAYGRPVIRSGILASLTARLNVKVIIGESVREGSGLEAKKLAALAGENVYELVLE